MNKLDFNFWRLSTTILNGVIYKKTVLTFEICVFGGLGWVMGLKWQMPCVGHTITDTRSRLSAEKVESVELIRWGLRAGLV